MGESLSGVGRDSKTTRRGKKRKRSTEVDTPRRTTARKTVQRQKGNLEGDIPSQNQAPLSALEIALDRAKGGVSAQAQSLGRDSTSGEGEESHSLVWLLEESIQKIKAGTCPGKLKERQLMLTHLLAKLEL